MHGISQERIDVLIIVTFMDKEPKIAISNTSYSDSVLCEFQTSENIYTN
jgi:hypothetical protein